MRKIKKWLALSVMAAGMLSSAPMTAFAFTDELAQEETEAPIVLEEPEPETEATPFSVPGNGQILDDKQDDKTKQFLTVQTKKGNTFFLVLDRSSSTENVYMLSMIDENDLAEFIEEVPGAQQETETEPPKVVIPELTPQPAETEALRETETDKTKAEKSEAGVDRGILAGGLLLLAAGIGFFGLRAVKRKKAGEETGGEDLEFYDGGAYIREDQEDSDGGDE